ncbi:MAG: heat-inducible transcription repressor HrcA [Armatimonadetes bacterium]|nr:heat-inducible transcription repressor HrcA [Armatimonadota bacterium]MBX3109542.1 heat-inducible transcription repressor HrcA [Fimbriimonadaceae bacterium]
MGELSERKGLIIRAIILEYVAGAEPVSSDLLASKYDLGVRSATIRNELAEITDLGYLDQPHTSAGRIPSDRGYRYFVDNLMPAGRTEQSEKRTLREATRDEDTLRDLVQETTKALSRMTKLMSAAVTVRDAQVKVRNAVVTALGPDRALFVLVLENGHTENRILDCPTGLTLEQIGQVNEALDRSAAGLTLGEAAKFKAPAVREPVAQALANSAAAAVKSSARELTRGYLFVEGEEYVLGQPEFQREPEALRQIIDSLSNEDALREEVAAMPEPGQSVTIGRENHVEPHYPLTFIRQTFRVGGQDAGIISIIGPRRMDYPRNMSLLDYTADSISDVLTRLFGK